ncbi:hypothetical protein VPH35_021159 [Triticum aestivum]
MAQETCFPVTDRDLLQGWVRIGATAPGRPPCPNRTTVLEKAIHGFADNPGDNVIVPALGTTFDSVREAYNFYNLCSWRKDLALDTGKAGLRTVGRVIAIALLSSSCCGPKTMGCRFPFLEELDESATLMEQAAFAVVRLAMSADKKVREEDRVKGVRREALPPESEMFNGKMNLHASGWVKSTIWLLG